MTLAQPPHTTSLSICCGGFVFLAFLRRLAIQEPTHISDGTSNACGAGGEQHVTILVGKLELIGAAEAHLDMIQLQGVIRRLLVQGYFYVTGLGKIRAQLHGLVARGGPPGLLLILLELLVRARLAPRTLGILCALVLIAAAAVTHARAALYGDEVALWTDTVRKAPSNYRAHFQLGQAEEDQNRCDLAAEEFQKAAAIGGLSYDLLVDWGLAYDCLNRPDDAIEKFRQAAAIDRSAHVYTQIAKVFAERDEFPQALDALHTAEQIDPSFAVTYVYRGKVRLKLGQPQVAADDFRAALRLDPHNRDAIEALAMAEQSLRGRR